MNSRLVVLVLLVLIVFIAESKKLSNKVRMKCLQQHNKIRSKVAKGKCANGTSGSMLPKAGDMCQLSYSKKLEKKAIKIAKKCTWSQPVGTNVFVAAGKIKPAAALKNATKSWGNELNAPNVTFSLKYVACGPGMNATGTGNFSQLIWAKTKEVGCAVQTCTNVTGSAINGQATFVVCKYKAAGNVDQRIIYKKSKKSGKKCPKGYKHAKKTGLCKKKPHKPRPSQPVVDCDCLCQLFLIPPSLCGDIFC
ncbi:SCP-like protein [Aphelenchoides bicaudatus]|nr:SCP-like protein [Aphelenchoides bicaudatus]